MNDFASAGLALDQVRRGFTQGKECLQVLDGADLLIKPGEIVALVGPSGAGKSTLLHIAGLLERPDQGEVWLAGRPCGKLSEGARTRLRRLHLGFVYQYHHLQPEFSAVENIILPQMIAGKSKSAAKERALNLLDDMGLKPRAEHRPGQLSGGEQQRTAICRALANQPKVLLADEPTGNLDPHSADIVFAQLIDLVRSTGVAALIATHNPDLARRMDRVVRMEQGRLLPGS